jgi:hypothetical protein
MTSGIECEVTAEYSNEEVFCALQMSCSRTGPSGELIVRRKDTVGLACNQDVDTGEWLCECTGNKTRQVVNFMRPAELTNDEVCRGAMDECVNSLDDVVGP